MVENIADYKWSSYNDYAYDRNLPIINKDLLLSTFGDKKNFIEQNSYVKDAP